MNQLMQTIVNGRIILPVLFSCLLANPVFSQQYQWEEQESGTGFTLFSSCFADAQTGWIAGGNDGLLFEKQSSGFGTSVWFEKVEAVTPSTAWILNSGDVIKTTDGGKTWVEKEGYFESISFADENKGWAITNSTNISVTGDGGDTWTIQKSGSDFMNWIYAFDSNHCWGVGNNGIIKGTSDGGVTWNTLTSGTSNKLSCVYFVNTTTGWAVGAQGTILKTTDGGTTWVPQSSGITDDLNSVHFYDALHGGIAADRATVLYTTDGGSTWNVKSGLKWPPYDLASIRFQNVNTAYAVGVFGTILKTTDGGNSWTSVAAGTTNWLNGIDIEGESIWIVGNSSTILKMSAGFIAKTSDGGANWVKQTSGTESTLYAVHCFDNQVAWAAGGEGTILKTTNGGNTWHPLASGQTVSLNDIFFINDLTGWAAGNGGTILKTEDGGDIWVKQTTGTTDNLSGIYFSSALKGTAVGSFGTLLVTADGGTTWELRRVSVYDLRSVYFAGTDTGFISGIRGTLLRTTDGGATWIPLQTPVNTDFYDIRFTDPTTGWMAGSGGALLKTTTGGEIWINQSDSSDYVFRSVVPVSSTQIYATGTKGTVWHSTGEQDFTNPVISISQPASGRTFLPGDMPFSLTGTITDERNTVCLVNGEIAILTNGNLNENLCLSPFDSSIVIKASDRAGNVAVKEIPVNIKADLPGISTTYYLGGNHDLVKSRIGTFNTFQVSYYTEPWSFEFSTALSEDMLVNRCGYSIYFFSGTKAFTLKWSILRVGRKMVISQHSDKVVSAGLISGVIPGQDYYLKKGDTLVFEIMGAYLGGFEWGSGASGGAITIASDKSSLLATPGLLLPVNGAVNQPLSLTLTWRKVKEASGYKVQVDDDADFKSPAFDYSGLMDTIKALVGLSHHQTYYWRVSSTTSTDTSAWSETRNFTTAEEVFAPTVQASDVTITSIGKDQARIGWSAGNGSRSAVFVRQGVDGTPQPADQTTYQADDAFGTGSQIGGTGWYCVYLGTATNAVITGLAPQTTYKVMAISLNGDPGFEKYLRETARDNPAIFTTTCDYDYYGTNPKVHLYFKDATTYDVEITNTHSCGTTTFKFLNRTLAGNSFSINTFPYPTTGSMTGTVSEDGHSFSGTFDITYSLMDPIYGYIVPCGALAGSWSASRSALPPAAPVLTSPVNNLADAPVGLTLNWNPSAGALSYNLEVSESVDFSSLFLSQKEITTDYFQLTGLEPSKTYYWRVSAEDACFTSRWTDSWSFSTVPSVPDPPTLLYPENNATETETVMNFSWNPSERAVSYVLQVSYHSDFSNTVVNQSGITLTNFIPERLSNNSTYYWRVCATNSGGNSDWSEIRTFTTIPAIPAIPVLISPANNATNQPLLPLLIWRSSENATTYRLVIATDPILDYIVVSRPSLTDTTYTPVALVNGTKYYWHVRANSGTVGSQWSETWSFTVIEAIPGVPVPVSPLKGAVNQPLSLTLNWNASDKASSYGVQVSTQADFSTTLINQRDVNSVQLSPQGLAHGTLYYWRVNASNTGGTSDWSEIQSFTTIPAVSDVPTLVSPVNMAADQPVSPMLVWNAPVGASGYTLQVSASPGFGTTVINQSGLAATSFTAGGLSNGTTYYWRVNAANAGGTSEWSEVRSFTTIPAVPGIPVLASPADNAVDQPLAVMLAWNATAGAASYSVQVSALPDFSSFVVNQSGLTSPGYTPAGLAFHTKYYWRVNASNTGGTSGWSQIRNFTTVPAVPDTPILASPANHSVGQPLSPSLSWNPAAGAVSYSVQVSTTFDFVSVIASQSGITATTWAPPGLTYGTKYFWRVNATNTGGTTAWCGEWDFTTTTGHNGSVETRTTIRYLQPNLTFSNEPYVNNKDQDIYVNNYVLEWKDTLTSDTLGNSFILNLIGGSQGLYGSILTAEILIKTIQGEISVVTKDFSASCFYTLPNYNIYPRRMTVEMTGILPEFQSGDILLLRIKVKSGAAGRIMYGTSAGKNYLKILGTLKTPTLSSPTDETVNAPVNQMFTWIKSEAATSYHLQVSPLADFSTTLFSDTNIVVNSQQVSTLAYSTKYYWRVKAKNFTGTSNWSEVWKFTTTSAFPSIPNLISPVNGALNQSLSVALDWNASEGASSYALQVSTQADFSSTLINQSGLAATSFTAGGLSNGTTYYWRVNAANAGGTSEWSEVRSFTTIPAVPGIPVLASPADNAVDQPLAVMLAWNATAGAASYSVQVSALPDFSSFVVNQSGLTSPGYTPAGLAFHTKYYWRVNASNTGGTSGWSQIRNFTTVPAVPDTPILASPANHSVGQPLSPSLSWNPAAGAVSYSVQVSTTFDFVSVIASQSGITATTWAPPGLTYGTKYFWRVNATNTGGTTAWCGEWDFTTTTGTQVPALQASNLVFTDIGKDKATVNWTRGDGSRSIVFIRQGSSATPALMSNSSYTAHATFGSGSEPGASGWYCVYLGTGNTTTITGLAPLTTFAVMVISLNGEAGDEKYLLQSNAGNPAEFTTLCDPDYYGNNPVVHLHYLSPSSFDVEITNSHSCGETTLTFNDRRLSGNTFTITVDAYPNTGSMQGTLSADGNSFTGSYQINYAVLHPQYGYSIPCGTKSGSWSAVRSGQGPAIPVPVSPADHAVNQPSDVTLRWEPSQETLFYSVELSKNSIFNPVIFSGSSITGTEHAASGLEPNTTYYWRVAAGNACYQTQWSVLRDFTTGSAVTAENVRTGSFRVYPNPAREQVHVECTLPVSGNYLVRIYDRAGRLVLSEEHMPGTLKLEVGTFRRGLYFVEILTEAALFRQKLVLF